MKTSLLLGVSILTLGLLWGGPSQAAPDHTEVQVKVGNLFGENIFSSRTGWFGNYEDGNYHWDDPSDRGRSALKGVKRSEPGISLPTRKTLGHWFDVELQGKIYRVRQVDVGPASWTKRGINVNSALADLAGYSPKKFPTGEAIKYRYVGTDKDQEHTNAVRIPLEPKPSPYLLDKLSLPDFEEFWLMVSPDLVKPKMVGGFPAGLHPVIKESMLEASKYLPRGYKLRFLNAARRSSTIGSSSYHIRRDRFGALAVDVSIVDSHGRSLKNIRSPENFRVYRDFMQNVKKVQYDRFPAYRGRGRWGGYFVFGVSQDLMHYDLGPEAGTMAGNWQQGLKPRYAHFGKKGDVGNGMGAIQRFKLPPLYVSKKIEKNLVSMAD